MTRSLPAAGLALAQTLQSAAVTLLLLDGREDQGLAEEGTGVLNPMLARAGGRRQAPAECNYAASFLNRSS